MTAKPTWSGRIAGDKDPAAAAFLDTEWNEELTVRDDVAASLAHVAALLDAGVLSKKDAAEITLRLHSLDEVSLEGHEDVHSAVEHALGPLGARLHAGRSRNDLVATDLRLFVRRAVLELASAVVGLQTALVDRAEETASMLAPGYTHLQRAQPVTVGHWLLAHAYAFDRDVDRLLAAHDRADVCPLGAGALAGNTLGIDPRVAAKALGFARAFQNSIDAVSARDFILDAVYGYATAATTLSRLAEEIVIWSSAEFGFVQLPDAFATGSSMMPQKKNPDVAELARAEPGAATGVLVDLLVTLKALPLAYDRDLQAVKRALRPLLRAPAAFHAMAGLLRDVEFRPERLREAASDQALLATDLAEALVARGVPFRRAHERVAGLVARAEHDTSTLAEAIRRSSRSVSPLAVEDAIALLDPDASVRRRRTPGGPSPASVRAQVRKLRLSLVRSRRRLERRA